MFVLLSVQKLDGSLTRHLTKMKTRELVLGPVCARDFSGGTARGAGLRDVTAAPEPGAGAACLCGRGLAARGR